MLFIITALIIFPIFYYTIGRSINKLWKSGLVGVGIMVVADYIGFRLNLYTYQNGLLMIAGYLPIMHIFNMFIISMMYVRWLPVKWRDRLLYTVYLSMVFLVIEGAMYKSGALIYINWKIGYSFILIIGGLILLAYLSDFVYKKEKTASL